MQAIMSQVKATGRDRTAVVVDALKQVFGFPSSNTSPASLEGLHKQVDALRKEIASLNQQLLKFKQEAPSGSNTQSPEELNPALATSQALISQDSLESPKVPQSPNVSATEDLTNTSKGTNPETERPSGRRDEFEDALQQLAAKVEQRARMLEQVLSASVDHVCMYDRLGRYTYANLSYMQSLGLERAELYGKTWQDLGLPADIMKPLEIKLQIALALGQSIAEEISLPTVSGVRDYEYILSPIHSADGSIEAVVYTARDITERKQAEESLRESEKNYRNLFEWAHDSIFITDSSTAHLLDVNEHAARRLGYTRKQLLHLPPEEISPPMDPEHREAVLRQLWQTGSVTFEHVHQCKNGSQMPVEVSSRVVEYGGQLAIQSFVRDITARKQAESALQESQHFIEQLSRTTPYLIYIQDLVQQRHIYLNGIANQFYGQTPEAIKAMGKRFLKEFLHPDDLPKLAQIKERLATARDGEVLENEYRMKNAKGEWRWFHSWEIVFSRTSDRIPQQILGTAIDITPAKQVEERLSLYQKMIAHSKQAIAIFDSQGHYVEQNPAHALLLGYSDSELLGLKTTFLFGEEVFAAIAQELIKTGRYYGSVTSRTKSRELLTLELEAFALRNEAGEVVCGCLIGNKTKN
jgi:PAS domain S-box-containing protein